MTRARILSLTTITAIAGALFAASMVARTAWSLL